MSCRVIVNESEYLILLFHLIASREDVRDFTSQSARAENYDPLHDTRLSIAPKFFRRCFTRLADAFALENLPDREGENPQIKPE